MEGISREIYGYTRIDIFNIGGRGSVKVYIRVCFSVSLALQARETTEEEERKQGRGRGDGGSRRIGWR